MCPSYTLHLCCSLFQCIELSKTNPLQSCPSTLTTTPLSAVLLAAQSHSVRPSCYTTIWNITMVRSSLWRRTAAPQGTSRPGPLRNRLLAPAWTAQRDGVPSLPLCVSSSVSVIEETFCINHIALKQGGIVNILYVYSTSSLWDKICFSLWFFADSVGSAAAPRGEVKTAGRRTSAPPAVNTLGHQHRALLREKSKENQLDRNGCHQQDKDSDMSGFDTGQYNSVRCLLLGEELTAYRACIETWSAQFQHEF